MCESFSDLFKLVSQVVMVSIIREEYLLDKLLCGYVGSLTVLESVNATFAIDLSGSAGSSVRLLLDYIWSDMTFIGNLWSFLIEGGEVVDRKLPG